MKYYECGICDHYHKQDWNGDCREDAARFDYDDIPDDAEVISWISWEEMQRLDEAEDERDAIVRQMLPEDADWLIATKERDR